MCSEAVGLDKPNIGLLDDDFLAEVRNLPERNLAVELLSGCWRRSKPSLPPTWQ